LMEVIVSPAAREDIRDIYAYYAGRNPDAAGRVVKAVIDAIYGLARFPLIGRQGVKPGTRERILTRYPYKVVYEIQGEVIEIDRVLHAARHSS
ncbi:MAG: type II toxin-antitoxin system RelE/ParE family toxin, partial [Chloroflexota bacterium]